MDTVKAALSHRVGSRGGADDESGRRERLMQHLEAAHDAEDWEEGGTKLPDGYRGEGKAGARSGLGVHNWGKGGGEYCGEWAGDRCEGVGVFRFGDGAMYHGEVKDGVPEGWGVLEGGAGKEGRWYEGQLRGGVPHGMGVEGTKNVPLVKLVRYKKGVLVGSTEGKEGAGAVLRGEVRRAKERALAAAREAQNIAEEHANNL